MRTIIKSLIIAIAGVLALGGAAQAAYTPPAGSPSYLGTNSVGTIANVDMNVELVGTGYYHEFDLDYTCGVDGVITFTGVGEQFDNDGERITGSLDTGLARSLTYTADYYTAGVADGRSWTVFAADTSLAGTATSGDIDWSGTYYSGSYNLLGGLHNVPNCAPAPVVGNHGQCVSGAVKAGFKGQNLIAISKDVTKIGAFGSDTCKF